MYSIQFTPKSDKQFAKLSKELKERVINSLERCKIRPFAHVKKLANSPFFSLRVGKYRVLLIIDNGKLVILVIEIGHRKGIYK